MAPQNPRDMRDYMRTLERNSTNQRALPALIENTIKVIQEEAEENRTRRPAAPVELAAQTALYSDANRRQRAKVILDFPDVVFNIDGTRATIQQYELWGRDETEPPAEDAPEDGPWVIQSINAQSTFVRDEYTPGSVWRFRARALGAEAVQPGEWSEEIVVQMLKDTTPPPQPSAPVVTGGQGQLKVTYDGLAAYGSMPSDLDYVILAHGTTSSPTTEIARFGYGGGVEFITGTKYYVPQFVRLRAVDQAGNVSPWSEQASGYTTPLVDADVILSELDAGKTKITNAGQILLAEGETLRQKLAEADAAQSSTQALVKTLKDTTLPALTSDLGAAKGRLDAAQTAIAGMPGNIEAAKAAAIAAAAAEAEIKDRNALAVAAADAKAKADAAQKAATDAAAADATAKQTAAVSTAAADAKKKADQALVDAKADATSKAAAAQKAAIDAAAADATAKTEATEATAATEAARLAKVAADAAQAASLAAAKEYADAQADGAGGLALEAAKADATAKANAAQKAAIDAAALDATAKKEEAERVAALDAKTKADAALAAAKTDAEAKATAAQKAATEAAAADATKKAADTATAAAADAKKKADQALVDAKSDSASKVATALTTAATDAQTKATKALNDAKSDATAKANAAQAAAITAADLAAKADATAKVTAAEARAATDAQTKATKALNDAKSDATAKADAAKAAALTAAAADAKAQTEAAEARAATNAAAAAKVAADAAQAAALAAAKEYADAQADGAGGLALEAAKADATAKANAAQAAAITAAALDATAKKEEAERVAAADAKVKADKALADAKVDAEAKATAAQQAATTAAAADATKKAADAATAAAADAKKKADQALVDAKSDAASKVATALTTAATDAQTKATKALNDAKSDATAKANAAQAAAITAADLAAKADATAKVTAAEARAATDAQTKATKALNDAKSDATAKADAAKAAALTAAAADAKSQAEAAEARAATEAARLAKVAADAAQAASLAAAKTYADAQADGAGGLALEAAKADATAKANAAQKAATDAAALDATAKKEEAERVAAADAKKKADQALVDAKADATAKANAAQTAATNAASADATKKAADAQAAAATDAQAKATKALTDAQADAKIKADNALAYALGAAARGNNVVINGSFDQDFTGWTREVTQDATNYGIDTTVSRTGGRSLWTSGKGGFTQQAVPVVPGQTWEMSLWYKTESTFVAGAGGLRLQALINGAWADASSGVISTKTDWFRSYVQYVIPAGVTQIRPRFAFNYTPGPKLWVDDVELVNITGELVATAAATKATDAIAAADRALAAAINVIPDPNVDLTTVWPMPARVSYSTVEKYSGVRSIQIVAGSPVATIQLGPAQIPVRPGDIWRISAYRKTTADFNGKTDNSKLRIGDAKTGTLISAANINRSETWSEVGIDVTIPWNVTAISATAGADHTVGTMWLDDFVLSNVTDARAATAAASKAQADAIAAAAQDATMKANFAQAEALASVERLAANAGSLAMYGDLEGMSGSTFPLNAATARSGQRAFTARITTGQIGATLPDIPVTAGNWYLVSFWMMSDVNLTSEAGMPVMWVAEDNTVVNSNWGDSYQQAHRGELVPGVYKKISFQVQAGSNIKAMRPRFYVWGVQKNTHADFGAMVYMDDFTVKDVTDLRTSLAAAAEAQRISLEAAQAASNLAGSMGRTWFQPEPPPPGRLHSWEGAANGSFSTRTAADGSVLAVNMHRNPGAVTSLDLHSWSGSGNKNAAEIRQVSWSQSGWARRITWTEVASPTTGDMGVGVRAAAADPRIGWGQPFTTVFKVRVGRTGLQLGTANLYSANSGTVTTSSARSPHINIAEADRTYEVYCTGTMSEGADVNARALFGNFKTLQPGDWIEVSDAIVYPGEYDPAKNDWFSGDSPDDRANDLWIDTDEGNTPKRWNGTEWVAVTDKAAIDAATAAAAADATRKADAALLAATTAAAKDATDKAAAAQKAATDAAAATAQAKVDAATATTLTAAAADAKKKADDAQRLATEAAATEAQLKANGAQAAAIAAAAEDAKSKADAAQRLATEAAASDATAKANKALADATATAASDATAKANKAQADAINASGLDASFKADEAERRAKAVAATAQTAADKAIADALAASGLAGTKGKTLFQTAAPGAADRNAQTLWIDTTGGANTPKRWTTGTTWVAVTDKVAADAATKATQAVTDASNAAAAARTAQSAADAAMSAAGSKATILYGAGDPAGVAAVNTIWRKTDAAGNVIGEWRYTGGTPAWAAQLVSTDMISNLDVGKLSVGSGAVNELVAGKIAAASAAFQTVDAKNIFVTGTASLDEVVARRLAAETGSFVQLGLEQLVVTGNASIKTAVADKLFANIFSTRKLTAEQVLIGQGDNLFMDPSLNDVGNKTGWYGDGVITANAGRNGAKGMVIPAVPGWQRSSWHGAYDVSRHFNVVAGETYLLSVWVKTSSVAPVGSVGMDMKFSSPSNPYGTSTTPYGGVTNTTPTVAGEWTLLSGQVKVGALGDKGFVGVMAAPEYGGSATFSDIVVRPAISAGLIVDGAITTKKLTVTEDMTVKLLAAHKIQASEINVNSLTADTGFIGTLKASVLSADTITGTMIKGDSITGVHIASDAITAKHTITGALVRTAATGGRTEMTRDGIRVIDTAGAEQVKIGYGLQTGMALRNPGTGDLVGLSNMVFGSEVYAYTGYTVLRGRREPNGTATVGKVVVKAGYVAVSRDVLVMGTANGSGFSTAGGTQLTPAICNVSVKLVRRDGSTPNPEEGQPYFYQNSSGTMQVFYTNDFSGSSTVIAWNNVHRNLVPGMVYDLEYTLSVNKMPKMWNFGADGRTLAVVDADRAFEVTSEPTVIILPR